MLQNNAKPPFDDINFRLAVAHAVDRKTIAEKIYYGLVEASPVPAPASSWWFDKQAADSLDYNLDKARAYLAKSKYQGDAATFELLTSAEALSARHQRLRRLSSGRARQDRNQGGAEEGGFRRRQSAGVPRRLSGVDRQLHVSRRAHLHDHGELHGKPVPVEGHQLRQPEGCRVAEGRVRRGRPRQAEDRPCRPAKGTGCAIAADMVRFLRFRQCLARPREGFQAQQGPDHQRSRRLGGASGTARVGIAMLSLRACAGLPFRCCRSCW